MPLKLLLVAISAAVASADSAEILQSPNQKIEIALNIEEGALGYSVKLSGKGIILGRRWG